MMHHAMIYYRRRALQNTPKQNKHNQIVKGIRNISVLVVEYIAAIDMTRVRFPADTCLFFH